MAVLFEREDLTVGETKWGDTLSGNERSQHLILQSGKKKREMYNCIFVCICIYECMYIHMYACLYVCMYVCMYVYKNVCIFACSMYLCMYAYLYECT